MGLSGGRNSEAWVCRTVGVVIDDMCPYDFLLDLN